MHPPEETVIEMIYHFLVDLCNPMVYNDYDWIPIRIYEESWKKITNI